MLIPIFEIKKIIICIFIAVVYISKQIGGN